MAKEKANEKSIQRNFTPETLLVFVGHSDDTKEEIKVIRDIEGKLQRELEDLLQVSHDLDTFKVVRIWDWNYDATLGVGGQEKAIKPSLERADIALFIFKDRIGLVTWQELLECKNRVENRIPILAVFPKNHSDPARLNDLLVLDNWRDLLQKKQELTADWTQPGSTSVTPVEDYSDRDDLLKIVFNGIKTLIPGLLKAKQTRLKVNSKEGKPPRFLQKRPGFSFDKWFVNDYSVDDLDQSLLKKFLLTDGSLEFARAARLVSPTTIEHLQALGLYEKKIVLAAFLCFAPQSLITKSFYSCMLYLASYDGVTRAGSKPQIRKVWDNLLTLFEEGMRWLNFGSGLKRRGTVGTKERDQLEIPDLALREALVNALIHRNYQTPGCRDQPTRIEVFEDRVVITSCGDLPKEVSVEALNSDAEKVGSKWQNPAIAMIFSNMTHAELAGGGIGRMRRETKRAGLPAPKIIAENNTVRVEFIRKTPEAIETLLHGDSASESTTGSKSIKTVFISSTVQDLPDHRKEVMEACLRQGLFPVTMENRPARDDEAISTPLEMIERSDIYVGIFAYRYGYIPKENNPDNISLVEMEYDHALRLGLPRLIFVIHEDHPVKGSDMERGDGVVKLDRLKERLSKEGIVNFFKSPGDLRAHVINAISRYKQEVAAFEESSTPELGKLNISEFHYVSDIPEPPEVYVAHPYTLLQTHGLVGRQPELNVLTNWVAKPDSKAYAAHILSVVGIGGMGKSALTWKWFEEIAPEEMKPLAGRMWWSFYESDASFENFIIRTLAYVSKQSIEEVGLLHPQDREAQLLSILDKEPFLLVLDGLERILIAYARMDAAYLSDSDYDKQTANFVANAYGLPPAAAQSFTGQHLVRRTADPRAGAFLKKLSRMRAARILISTRLYPFDLQRGDALPLPGCFAVFLPGLSNDDALNLWRFFGVSGSHNQLIPIFNSFENHALLIQALASEIANYRPAPGNFEKWREANPDFDPAKYPHMQDAMGHVLEYALRGLGAREQNVLQTIAGFRMPTHYDTLSAILTGKGKSCKDAGELDAALAELEDRGLVGWDKRANRYDLHPIVRGVVWGGLGNDARQGVYASLHSHFEAVPMIGDWEEVNSLEDLTPAIELYNTLIGMGRFDDAVLLFSDRLNKATLYRLSASRQRVEMLEMLFPDGLDETPKLSDQVAQGFTLNSLAQGYKFSGQPGRAVPMYRSANAIAAETGNEKNLETGLENLSDTMRVTGRLRESEEAARRALIIARGSNSSFDEAASLYWLGLALAVCGEADESGSALRRSLRMFLEQNHSQSQGLVNVYLAQRAIRFGESGDALSFANHAWELAQVNRLEGDFIRAARMQGEAALGLNDLDMASERLHHALTRARAVSLVEEELPALITLAELGRRQGDKKGPRELLDDVWEFAERGPYPLFHADALNVLTQIERDAGNTEKAIEAAAKAYQLAWCDGPPYAYHWGLIKAQKHLEELGAPLPEMPPFDESKFEPMPEVEIDPKDEFHHGANKREPDPASKSAQKGRQKSKKRREK